MSISHPSAPDGAAPAAGRTVLVADDDPRLRSLLHWTLERGNFRVVEAADGNAALERAHAERPDLFVIDVTMPGLDGFELCRRLRQAQVISPILLLTGRGDEQDKITGLEAGADDYQTKPFGSRELLARVNALLRRSQTYAREPGTDTFSTGDLRIDFDQHLVYKCDRQVDLTPTEFHILAHLARNAGTVVPGQALLTKVWGPAYREEVHLLRVNIARLRRKIEDNASEPAYVVTHARAGYALARVAPPATPAD